MARFEEIKQTPEIANSLSQELDILKNTKKEMIVLCNKEVETDEDRKAFDDFKKLVNYLNDMNIVIDLFQKFTDEFYEKGVSVFEWTVEVALKFDLKDLSRFGISQKVIEGKKKNVLPKKTPIKKAEEAVAPTATKEVEETPASEPAVAVEEK